MSKNILATLFKSRAKIKLLKYIYQHPDEIFTVKNLSTKIQEAREDVETEIDELVEVGMLHRNQKRL